MAAAYAALVSLLNTLDHIQIHPLLSITFNNYPNESLREKIDSLVDFVEIADSFEEAEYLLRRIAVVAHEAENIIELHASSCVRSRKRTKKVVAHRNLRGHTFLFSLQRILDDMDSIKEHIKEETRCGQPEPASSMLPASLSSAPPATSMSVAAVEDDEITGNHHQLLLLYLARYLPCLVPPASCLLALLLPPASSSSSVPPTPMVDNYSEAEDLVGFEANEETGSINQQQPTSSSSSAKTTDMVGFDGYLEQLLDRLTRHHSGSRQIIPIVGMGGIGKTTLARNVYDNALVVEHFDVRAWVTVSQQFSVSKILLEALSCLGGSNNETDRTYGQLGLELYKILYGRRFLIILDDVWSVEALEEIMCFFPENNNGSRIVITTRQSELVRYFGSSALVVDFLDDKNSWMLLCEKAFPQHDCPPELVEIGKKIVVKCKGLPLAIVMVGGLLGKSPRTLEFWEKIAEDKSLLLYSEEGNNASGVLYLSYKHMPVWLKSCFLYLGLFPEDYPIRVSQLIKLWVAEGYIKSNTDQSLEQVAENYVNELVDRNLVLVGGLKPNKKLKTCLVHDVVRDLCLRIAAEENFYCVQRDIDRKRDYIVDERTARLYYPEYCTWMSPSLVDPLLFSWQTPVIPNFRLSRVRLSESRLYMSSYYDCHYFEEVNLRLLIIETSYYLYRIPQSVSRLWSLQTLIIVAKNHSVSAPHEIWEMPQLRHINIKRSVCLPPPSDDAFVLQNLQTLETVENLTLTKEVCKRIPNIKKLGIHCDWKFEEEKNHLRNVEFLNKLESLRFSCWGWENAGDMFRNLKLPCSLKKLILERCKLVWSDMAMIGSLPHLQTLKLLVDAVVGDEWNCVEGEFLSLKHLQISGCDQLNRWNADSSSFPVLETLSLENLSQLEEIPSDIGDIPTLEKINLFRCRNSIAFSAVKILEEQESFGNPSLQVRIRFDYDSEAKKLEEKIKKLNITCQNLYIYSKRDC